MARSQLRVYYGPETSAPAAAGSKANPSTATLQLSDVLPMLVDAARHQRAWLADFMEDEITISTDLYEVILAYQHYRRPA
ncbi:MAG: hypothetical protein K1X71_02350 [Pirellulales bacterium]|nr:hypothetical protein [Pirellulales bacterium]